MRLAVVGDPIEHSRSPLMHTAAMAALQALGWELDSPRYEAWLAPVEALPAVLAKARAEGLRGLNFTVPHKLEVMRLVDEVAPSARAIGAANTLVREADRWVAHNTDSAGFWAGLLELRAGHGASRGSGSAWLTDAVVLGSGGASLAVVHAIETAAPEATLHWVTRRPAGLVARDRRRPRSYDQLVATPPAAQLWVNTTTVGMAGGPTEFPRELPLAALEKNTCVVDIVYPRPPGGLLDRAEARGAWVQDGLPMLLWQGVRALELWLGKTLPNEAVEAMREALAHPDTSPFRKNLGDVLHVG